MREVPQLVKLQQKYAKHGLSVVGVTAADRNGAQEFASTNSVRYPVLANAGKDVDAYEVLYVPATFLVDTQGVVVADDLEKIQARLETEFGG